MSYFRARHYFQRFINARTRFMSYYWARHYFQRFINSEAWNLIKWSKLLFFREKISQNDHKWPKMTSNGPNNTIHVNNPKSHVSRVTIFYEIRGLQWILNVFSMLEPVLWVVFGLDTIFNVISTLEPVFYFISTLEHVFYFISTLEPVFTLLTVIRSTTFQKATNY